MLGKAKRERTPNHTNSKAILPLYLDNFHATSAAQTTVRLNPHPPDAGRCRQSFRQPAPAPKKSVEENSSTHHSLRFHPEIPVANSALSATPPNFWSGSKSSSLAGSEPPLAIAK
ncbi:hypothetical protein IC575_007860 [Cucumis melo]